VLINLWTRSVFDCVEIYRSDSPDGQFKLVKTEIGEPAYFDTGLKPNTTYYYKVRLGQAGHWGPFYETVAFTTGDVIIEWVWGGAYLDSNTVLINLWTRSVFDSVEIYRSDSPDG
jgi:hypothetical protein